MLFSVNIREVQRMHKMKFLYWHQCVTGECIYIQSLVSWTCELVPPTSSFWRINKSPTLTLYCCCHKGNWTSVLGPAKPIRYPLSGGTLLFLLTVSLLPWVIYLCVVCLVCLPGRRLKSPFLHAHFVNMPEGGGPGGGGEQCDRR